MKALTHQGMKNVKYKNVEDPKIHGMIPNMPKDYVIGHETMGIVEAIGPMKHV